MNAAPRFGEWTHEGGLWRRQFPNYRAYLAHQGLRQAGDKPKALAAGADRARKALGARLDGVPAGISVLCLGARAGGEVLAFIDRGCFAVGIDVLPREDTLVLRGDFQRPAWGAGCLDAIYTNSMDHAADPEGLARRVRRLLRPGGLFVLEAVRGAAAGIMPRRYESFWWDTVDDLLRLFGGWQVERRAPFEEPYPSEHVRLRP